MYSPDVVLTSSVLCAVGDSRVADCDETSGCLATRCLQCEFDVS